MSKVVAIIQARLTSTRLPRKVLKKIGNKTMLQHVIDRVRKSKLVDTIVVASPHKIKFTNAESFIGSEKDVLDRYYCCADKYKANIIVRVTSDCPLIDPEIIDYAIRYMKRNNLEYVCFAPLDGLDVEVFTQPQLARAWEFALDAYDREHVTPYMRRENKISVDTQDDFDWVEGMVR